MQHMSGICVDCGHVELSINPQCPCGCHITKNVQNDLHLRSPEIHAAIHVVADIAIQYHQHRLIVNRPREEARNELFENLIDFFCNYDKLRAEQVESLKAQVIELMQWSVKPSQFKPNKEKP